MELTTKEESESFYMINHGKTIVRDYQQKKLLGKIKTFLSNLLSRFLLGTSIGVFVLAGFFSADVLTGLHL